MNPCAEMDHILGINCLRNLTGYMEDCRKNGVEPSSWQMLLFFEEAASVHIPPALEWVPDWLLITLNHGFAWWAESVLGHVNIIRSASV